jgi:hypothetical protein
MRFYLSTYLVLIVNVFDFKGEIFSNSEIAYEYEAVTMEWCPTDKILAVAWADGIEVLKF